MEVPTSYFGNVPLAAPAPAPAAGYGAAAAVVSPEPAQSRTGSVALYVGVGLAITMLLLLAWWWSRTPFDHKVSSSPETLELDDFRQRIASIEDPDHREDMEEWLRLCRGSVRPTVNAILIEVLRSNLGPGAGGTAPPPDGQAGLTPPEAARPPSPSQTPTHRLVGPADADDQSFVRFR